MGPGCDEVMRVTRGGVRVHCEFRAEASSPEGSDPAWEAGRGSGARRGRTFEKKKDEARME